MAQEIKGDFNKETEDAIYFFTPPFYALDNFSAYTVEIWGKQFQTSEHAYQWKKYSVSHPELAEQILNTKNPNAAKKISDAHKKEGMPNWSEVKVGVMEEILRAKIAQHEKVQKVLEETGTKTIVENSPQDNFWGIGDGSGRNELGKLWMRLREEFRTK